jgi:hypothetical protein
MSVFEHQIGMENAARRDAEGQKIKKKSPRRNASQKRFSVDITVR